MLALARHLALPDTTPKFTNGRFDKWVSPFLDVVWDDERSLAMFQETASLIEESNLELSRSAMRNAGSLETLKRLLEVHISTTEGVTKS